VEGAVRQFKAESSYITDFSSSPCLFPAALRPIADVAVVNRTDFIRLEGQRMVGKVKDAVLLHKATQQQQRELVKRVNKATKSIRLP
jgi:hypothetical protein